MQAQDQLKSSSRVETSWQPVEAKTIGAIQQFADATRSPRERGRNSIIPGFWDPSGREFWDMLMWGWKYSTPHQVDFALGVF